MVYLPFMPVSIGLPSSSHSNIKYLPASGDASEYAGTLFHCATGDSLVTVLGFVSPAISTGISLLSSSIAKRPSLNSPFQSVTRVPSSLTALTALTVPVAGSVGFLSKILKVLTRSSLVLISSALNSIAV